MAIEAKNTSTKKQNVDTRVELITKLNAKDLNDLCDATTLAIESGGGFGWLRVPERDVMERFWQGVVAMPLRHLFVTRLDDVICGTGQMILPPQNNEAQSHAINISSVFIAPWARGYGLGSKLIETIEARAKRDGFNVANLDVRETQTEAISLFENAGYVQCGIHPSYAQVDGKDVHGYFYFKKLKDVH